MGRVGETRLEGNYYRTRVRDPRSFQPKSFRTLDVGKRGGLELVVARKRGEKTLTTQAAILPRKDYNKGLRVKLVGKSRRVVVVKASRRARSHTRRVG